MAVVVSDTTPLHYLILVGRETILEKLYGMQHTSMHLDQDVVDEVIGEYKRSKQKDQSAIVPGDGNKSRRRRRPR